MPVPLPLKTDKDLKKREISDIRLRYEKYGKHFHYEISEIKVRIIVVLSVISSVANITFSILFSRFDYNRNMCCVYVQSSGFLNEVVIETQLEIKVVEILFHASVGNSF